MVRLALAAPNGSSSAAGAAAAHQGGNAVDVALAAMFAALVSEPGISSLGGGAFVTIGAPGQEAITVDGSVAMPGLGRAPDAPGPVWDHLFLDYAGGTTMQVGPASVAVPGALPAFELAHQQHGQLAWGQVVAPAARLAREGFRLGAAAAHYLSFAGGPLFGRDPAAAAVLTGPDGAALRLGEEIRMPELGDFLDQVGRHGSAALMAGPMAAALVELMAGRGGLITAHDLASYRPVVRASLPIRCAGWTLAANPAPAVGGPVLAAMIALLGPEPGRRVPLGQLVAVQRQVLSARVRELDSAADRIEAARALVESATAGDLDRFRRGSASPSTVHVSAVDDAGLACAITTSSGYGSGLSVPGTGVWLNSCLGEPELNRRAVAPGERLVSNMTPTVARHDDGRVLAIGSPGADRIVTAVLQTLLALVAGDELPVAVARPRVHVAIDADGAPARVEYEAGLQGGLQGEDGVALDLPWREHPVLSMFFGGVGAALLGADGALEAAADPRRDGATLIT